MNKIDLGTISIRNNDPPKDQLLSNSIVEVEVCENQEGSDVCQMQNDICFCRCEGTKSCDLGCVSMEEQGRILDISLKIRNVCPGKRIAVGVVLTEKDEEGNECPIATKIKTVPAHNNDTCMDVTIPKIRFVIPEDICVSGSPDICCNCRHFVVRVSTNYIDSTCNHCGCCCDN